MVSQRILENLKYIVGPEDVLLEAHTLEAYSLDAFGAWGGKEALATVPERVSSVVRPSSSAEVVEVVKLACREKVPLVPYGGGTGVMGAVTPLRGGIAVDLKKMNRVLAIKPEDRLATVEGGILLGDLDRALNQEGLMLGHDPYSVPIATVGGAIATNGVGYRAAKYGSMGDQVAGLEVVLPYGEVLQTRAVPKHSVGPSLHNLFIGSEGVLGIITQATIKVFRLPEARVFKTMAFPQFEHGFNALLELFALGLRPALLDLTEEPQESPSGYIKELPVTSKTTLYLVFEGYTQEVEAQVSRTLEVCRSFKGEDVGSAPTREYWDTRHDSAYRYRESFLGESRMARFRGEWPRRLDYPHVAIPASKVLEYRRQCQEIAVKRQLWVREYALWTQPELFSMILVDISMSGQGEPGKLAQAVDEVLTLAQDLGGSMEYVHGVGVKLAHLLPRELGTGLEVLRNIKATMDPHNIMNPGKLGL